MTIKLENRIGDSRQKEFNEFLDKDIKRKLLISPTDSGKTYATIQYAKANPHKRIALLCPYISLVDNLRHSYNGIPCGYGKNWLKNNEHNPFIITTYDSIKNLSDMDMFIVDEAHLMAGHSSFREVIENIFKTNVSTTFITGTPEVIENLFSKNDGSVLRFEHYKPEKKGVQLYCGEYNLQNTINNIINKRKRSNNNKTTIIRVNSKDVINKTFETFKNTTNIYYLYSDEDNVLSAGQEMTDVNDLRKGKISEKDIILCTSIYDAGLSFEVDRDIECYAISQNPRYLPNPIDMIQLSARVRKDSGYKMDLTIIGNDGEFSIYNESLKHITSARQLCKRMSVMYEEYSEIDRISYVGLLNYYNIDVVECTSLDVVNRECKVNYSADLSDFQIATNFITFTEEYNVIKGMLEDKGQYGQIEILKGQMEINYHKDSAQVQQVFNILKKAVELDIDFNIFISDGSFSKKTFKAIESLLSRYTSSSQDTFSNLIREMAYQENKSFNYRELGLFELSDSDMKNVKTIYNMMYKKNTFRRASQKMKLREDVSPQLVDMINFLSSNSTYVTSANVQSLVTDNIEYKCDNDVLYEVTNQTQINI